MTELNERVLNRLIRRVASLEGPRSYTGVSWRDLQRFGSYTEPGFELTETDMKLTQVYAGLAVLTRDLHNYLAQSDDEDAALVQEVIAEIKAQEQRRYGPVAFPYDDPAFPYKGELEKFPQGLAARAAAGEPTVNGLGEPRIVHEWTVKAGKRLFLKFGEKFKVVICGENGPYELFEKDLLKQSELPVAIVAQILVAGLSTATLWYPLAVYIGLLIVRTGLKTYCEPDEFDLKENGHESTG
jgi:hypothetical protein